MIIISGYDEFHADSGLVVDGQIRRLGAPLIHGDFKDLEAYISRYNKYST